MVNPVAHTGFMTEGGDFIVIYHKFTEALTASLKAQFLNMACVHFSVDWAFWYFWYSIYEAPRPAS